MTSPKYLAKIQSKIYIFRVIWRTNNSGNLKIYTRVGNIIAQLLNGPNFRFSTQKIFYSSFSEKNSIFYVKIAFVQIGYSVVVCGK